jgi:hypothetical protein
MDKIGIRDLRIDNWIYHKDCPIPLQVSGIKDEVYLKHSFEHNRTVGFVRRDRPSACSIDEIKPIPLTAEILEKNDFKLRNRYIWERKDNYCCVKLNIAPKIEIEGEILGEPPILLQIDGATFSLNIIVEYVHELQNALRLCGIEKEIII